MSKLLSLTVNGMKCTGCENTVVSKLSALEGIVTVSASHLENSVNVEYDATKIDADEIEEAIIGFGYQVF